MPCSGSQNRPKLTHPRLCGLLGVNPSGLSQAMHNAAFQAANLPYTYVAFDTLQTEAGIRSMRELGFRGLSLTIPHKEKALTLVDRLSDEARRIGAINTIVNDGSILTGYNTDCYGVTQALLEAEFSPAGKRAIVYGAGGAARAAVYALVQMQPAEIVVVNRTDKRAQELATIFSTSFKPAAELDERQIQSADLLINAVPLHSDDPSDYPYPLAAFGAKHWVFDMVTRDTALLQAAKAAGAKPIAGIRMLLHQAVRQFELFTEISPAPIAVMEQALMKEYSTPFMK